MVLPPVLCDPSRNPRQADGCDRAGCLNLGPVVHVMARYLALTFCALPDSLLAVLLCLRDPMRRAWLARLQAAGRHLRHSRAHLHRVLFRVFPGHPAVARYLRKNQAGAEFNFGIGTGREGVSGSRLSYSAYLLE